MAAEETTGMEKNEITEFAFTLRTFSGLKPISSPVFVDEEMA